MMRKHLSLPQSISARLPHGRKRYLSLVVMMTIFFIVGLFLFYSRGMFVALLPFTVSTTDFGTPTFICPLDAYGGINDGTTLNTTAFVRAIEDCSSHGGGTVIVPEGHWLTGPIHLKSNIRLEISEKAEVFFSQNFSDYLPVVFSRYEGMELYNYSPLIYAADCQNVAIGGKGTLNGQGAAWWEWKAFQSFGTERLYQMIKENVPVSERIFGTTKDALRPSFIQFINCSGITLEDFTITNGPMWTIHPIYSSDILIRNLTVRTEGANNDGIVIDSSRDVLIENSTLDTEDDAIVIKSGLDADGWRVGKPSENIVIRNCVVGRGNGGIVIGSEMSGDVRNVTVSNCEFNGAKRGIRIKSARGRGGIVENIQIDNVRMTDIEQEAIFLDMTYYSKNSVIPSSDTAPTFRNISFKNIICSRANTAIKIIGLPENPITQTSFSDIDIKARNGIEATNITASEFNNIHIVTEDKPTVTFKDTHDILFEGKKMNAATFSPKQK